MAAEFVFPEIEKNIYCLYLISASCLVDKIYTIKVMTLLLCLK